MKVVRIVIAMILPPLAVLLTVGLGLHFWLNILLTLCFFLPGMVHAIWLVVRDAHEAAGPAGPTAEA